MAQEYMAESAGKPLNFAEMVSMIDVSVVIVSHNHAAYLPVCLSSVQAAQNEATLEVFLVDNCSEDTTVSLIKKDFPWVKLLINRERKGFSANYNQGLRASKGRYVFVLNPDTELKAGAIRTLIDYMDSQPEVGICGPQLHFPDDSIQPSCRRFPTMASVLVRRTPLRRWLLNSSFNARHLMDDFDHTNTSAVDWMLGAALFVRRKFLQTVGLLDEGYNLYVEDIDWAYRAHQDGWKVIYCPNAHIIHHHMAISDHRLWGWHSKMHIMSMWRYFRKHMLPDKLQLKVKAEILTDNKDR
jgi:N-acetylglucosaminyl-diphospho-decaprenol L-rhamnosyltransferase